MPPKTKSRDSEREIQKAEEQFNKLIGGPLVTEPEGEEISNKLILSTNNILSLFNSYVSTLGMHLTLANDCPTYRLTNDYILKSCGFSRNFHDFHQT